MFYSFDALNSRNGRFRIIWRAATMRKKLTRREIVEVDVSATCEELMQCIPTNRPSAKQAKSKFSLYLLAQLLYGTCVIYREQQSFFTGQVNQVLHRMRHPAQHKDIDLPLDKREGRDLLLPEVVPQGGRRRGVGGNPMRPKTLDDLNFVFDFSENTSGNTSIMDFSQLDEQFFVGGGFSTAMDSSLLLDETKQLGVRSARLEDITMVENLPYSRVVIDDQDELAPPTQEEQEMLKSFLGDDRLPRAEDGGFAEHVVIGDESSLIPPDQQQPIEREPLIEQEAQQPPQNERVETPQSQVKAEEPTFDLDAIVPEAVLAARAVRALNKAHRKRAPVVDSKFKQIPTPLMQAAIADPSDLMWTEAELRVDVNLNKFPGIDKLFAKPPVYIRHLAPKLVDLFDEYVQPRPHERITAQMAWNQPGILLPRRQKTPSPQSSQQSPPPDQLQQPIDQEQQPVDHHETGPIPKRRKMSAAARTPSPVLRTPLRPGERTPEFLETEQPRAGGVSVGSFNNGRASSMLPEATLGQEGDDIYMAPDPLAPISEHETVSEQPLGDDHREPIRPFSRTLLPPSRFELGRKQFLNEIETATADKPGRLTTFADLTEGNDRAQAAKKFYLVLSLLKSKQRKIAVRQTENCGPIHITVLDFPPHPFPS